MSNFYDSFLDNLPAEWKFDRLKDIISLRNEKTDVHSEEEDYLELEDLESGTGRILKSRIPWRLEARLHSSKKMMSSLVSCALTWQNTGKLNLMANVRVKFLRLNPSASSAGFYFIALAHVGLSNDVMLLPMEQRCRG
ncbi:MAG: hypothetical protein U5R30_21220 [Deltaproteobacteria bacterium]|nr:hypothetical protein [Deltaproteobacteria bacterium]